MHVFGYIVGYEENSVSIKIIEKGNILKSTFLLYSFNTNLSNRVYGNCLRNSV